MKVFCDCARSRARVVPKVSLFTASIRAHRPFIAQTHDGRNLQIFVVENSKADWIIVFGHHPVLSSGKHGSGSSTVTMYNDYRALMLRHKVAIYVCGHDHALEHIVQRE